MVPMDDVSLIIVSDITERKQADDKLKEYTHHLGERVKELNCLYSISNLIKTDINLEEIFQKTVNLIPPSWQYPEITSARILFEHQEYTTDNFIESQWKQACEITVHGKISGSVEVFYRENKTDSSENPFLKEELDLIRAICQLLKDTIERNRVEKELAEHRNQLEVLIEERTADLRKSQDRFKGIFNNMSNGVAVYESINQGQDFIFKELNPAAQRIDKINKTEIIGKPVTRIFPGIEEFGLLDVFQRVWKTGQPEHFPVSLYKDDRIHGWRENYVIKLPTGEVVVIYDDITKRKLAEKEKEELEEQLRQSQKMEAIGTLAGGVAHDFNNILSSVLGYTEIAMSDLPEESEIRSDLQEVLKAGNRATELVQQILTFSRKSEQKLRPLQIQLIVKEVIKLLRSSIPSTIKIKQNIAPDSGYVLADPTQIHQVIMNLCTNSYHSMRESGGVLSIFLKQIELNHDKLDLVITDMTMPNMTGIELAGKILEIRPDIPIILCSGYSELINSDQAKDAGISGYISKPILKRNLAGIVKKTLDENKKTQ